MKHTPTRYTIEITDLFGGEANYSWVKRFDVQARSFRGAAQHLARNYGAAGWRKTVECGDYCQYVRKGGCVTAFITERED